MYGEALDTGEPIRVEESEATLGRIFDLNIFSFDRDRDRVAVLFTDVTKRKADEEAARALAQRNREILESISDAFYAVDRDWYFTYVNRKAEEWWGRTREELIGKHYWTEFPEAVGSEPYEAHHRAAQTREVVRLEAISPVLGRWIDLTIYPAADGGLSVYFRDITEKKAVEHALEDSAEHQRTLVAELQHRVRNILAMLRSIVGRTSRNKEDVGDFVAHLQGRIDAMARTQATLTRSAGATVSLEEIIREELLALAARDSKFRLRGPRVDLSGKAAEVLTLAIHELATNSMKYGALRDVSGGALEIAWSLMDRDGEKWVRLRWVEHGISDDPGRDARGFGTELLTERVPYELGGQGEMKFEEETLTATIAFPLRRGSSVLETGTETLRAPV
jgi:PAS domain S-box-containing protein